MELFYLYRIFKKYFSLISALFFSYSTLLLNTVCKCKNIKTDEDIKHEAEEQRPIDKFFEQKYFYYFIWPYRKILLAVFSGVFLVFFFFATQLRPDPDPPQLFPSYDPYQRYGDIITDNFASDSSFQLTNQIVFGLKGIDRSGTDETVPDDFGDPKYKKILLFFNSKNSF